MEKKNALQIKSTAKKKHMEEGKCPLFGHDLEGKSGVGGRDWMLRTLGISL